MMSKKKILWKALPLILAVVGIGALATAILLVPPMIKQFSMNNPQYSAIPPTSPSQEVSYPDTHFQNQSLDSKAQSSGQVESISSKEQKDQRNVGAVDGGTLTERTIEDNESASGSAETSDIEKEDHNANSITSRVLENGTIIIVMNSETYEMDPNGSNMIDKIVSSMLENKSSTVLLTGVNNPSKSSRRARVGALKVRDRILESGQIPKYRIETEDAQDQSVEGLEIRAVIKGGVK